MTAWPFAGDGPTVRARKIAWAYRAALSEAGLLDAMAELDERFCSWGEGWISPNRTFKLDDMVTAAEASTITGLDSGTISSMRVQGRLKGTRDGKRYLYKVSDLHEIANRQMRKRPTWEDRVTANGRSVSNE